MRDTDAFKMNGYDSVRNEFSVWLDSLACIFAKFDDYSLDLSFFQSESGKPGEWFSRPSGKEMLTAHEFEPTRYTFSPIEMG